MSEDPRFNMDMPVDVVAAQEAAARASKAEYEAARKRAEADAKIREARERAEAEALAARNRELEEENAQMAKERAKADKEAERKRYIAAGGDPDDFESDYVEIRRARIAQRQLEQDARIATPRDYMGGLGGGFTRPLKPIDR